MRLLLFVRAPVDDVRQIPGQLRLWSIGILRLERISSQDQRSKDEVGAVALIGAGGS